MPLQSKSWAGTFGETSRRQGGESFYRSDKIFSFKQQKFAESVDSVNTSMCKIAPTYF